MNAFLPPHCDRPIQLGAPPSRRACSLAGLALDQAEQMVSLLESEPLTPPQLAHHLCLWEQQLAAVESCFEHDPQRRHAGQTIRWQRYVWADTDEHESPATLESYRIYDTHFGVMRMDHMSWSELAHQTVCTLRRTACDLPNTLLSRENYRALLVAAHGMLVQSFPKATGSGPITSEPGQPLNPVAERWRNGHHLFGLCCYYGRESLHAAMDSLDREDTTLTCSSIRQGATYLAASSAALAYTTDFPASRYLREIRSAMPAGFSGSHNSDFNHFKLLKGKLQVALMQKWGPQSQQWPGEVVTALRYFREIDLLDLDQHILVAASRIGIGPSLKQIGAGEADTSALEALRNMAAARRHDFHL
ncbi:hypothetical protein IV102_30360 [bacterium]|nr:hypothetical protein [bacterium]